MIAQGKKGQQELRETFSRLLESEDKNSSAAKFMRETVASKSAMPAGMREKFKPDANKFNAAPRGRERHSLLRHAKGRPEAQGTAPPCVVSPER